MSWTAINHTSTGLGERNGSSSESPRTSPLTATNPAGEDLHRPQGQEQLRNQNKAASQPPTPIYHIAHVNGSAEGNVEAPKHSTTQSDFTCVTARDRAPSTLLKVMSFLHPAFIQSQILYPAATAAQLSGYPATQSQFVSARNKLLQQSLIGIIPGAMDFDGLLMEKEKQDQVIGHLKASDQYCAFFVVAVSMVVAVWPAETPEQKVVGDFGQRLGRWAICEGLLPHVLKLKDMFDAMEQAESGLCSTYQLVLLCSEVAW